MYTCQNATLLEITCHGSFDFVTVAGAASSDDERKNEREELKPQ